MLALLLLPVFAQPTAAQEHGTSSAEVKSQKRDAKTRRPGAKKGKKGPAAEENIEPESVVGGDRPVSHKEFETESRSGAAADAVVLLDSSGSMQRTDPYRLRDQGAKLFLRFLGNDDRVAVMQFDREVTPITELTQVSPQTIPELDHAVDNVSVEGRFTDLEAAVSSALNMLQAKARPEAIKTVILLSDGKMDPPPSKGTREEATNRTLNELLPQYKSRGIKLYTLSLSDEADKELLSAMAERTGGLHWYAPNVDRIHMKFSDLFLALKQPQLVPMQGNFFEIDAVSEATFYINRKDPNQQIAVVTPTGEEIKNTPFPDYVRWFKGELFDVITIKNPIPGRWRIEGIEQVEGFATLLTDLKLEARWPEESLKLGDTVALYVRMTEKGEVLKDESLKPLLAYSYKIVDPSSGDLLSGGTLRDDGKEADDHADDGIYSAKVKLEKEGDFRAMFAVIAPTFTRQRQVNFSVVGSMISLAYLPADEFTAEQDRFQVEINERLLKLKDLKVQLIAHPAHEEGKEKDKLVQLKPQKKPNILIGLPNQLQPGSYKLTARVSGIDKEKDEGKEQHERFSASSATVDYESKAPPEAETPDAEPVPEEETPSSPFVGELVSLIVFVLLSLAWMGGLAFYVLKHFKVSQTKAPRDTPYVVPEELEAKLADLRQKSSKTKRAPSKKEFEAFKLVSAEAYYAYVSPPESGRPEGGAVAPEEHEEQPEAA